MVKFHDAGISMIDVPNENTLCYYLTGCSIICKNCHYPELQNYELGECLADKFYQIFELYSKRITCVAFMGEGQLADREELLLYANYIHGRGIKTCIYCGRNIDIENWMYIFDYVKIGAYIESKGPLTNRNTNQRMFYKVGNSYIDISYWFWNKGI